MAIPVTAALNAYSQAASMGGSTATPGAAAAKGAGGFSDFLEKAINDTVSSGKVSEQQMATSAASKDGNIVDVVTAVAEAETTLQTVVAVRDKVIAAYQDIMRMPI